MQPKKLESKEIFILFEKLSHHLKDNRDPESLNKDVVSLMLYKHLISFSKEELESARKNDQPRYADYTLFDEVILHLKNSMLLMAILSTSAFKKNLCANSKWVLKNSKIPDLYTYSLILSLERFRINKENYNYDFDKITDKDYLLKSITNQALIHKDNNNLLSSYYEQFKKINHKIVLDQIFKADNNPEGFQSVINLLKENNVDINEFSHLNTYLPTNKANNLSNTENFFISSSLTKHIKKYIDLGFRINESYTFNNKSLFHNLILSEREDLILLFLPTLKQIVPESKEKQIQLELDMDELEHKNKIKTDIMRSIFRIYHKHKLEIELPQKTSVKSVLKI